MEAWLAIELNWFSATKRKCKDMATLVEQNPTARFTDETAISLHAEPSADDALLDMLADLCDARAEAVEEGFPPPSDLSITRAERVLTETRHFSTRRFEVYPTPDGEIAIDMPIDGGSVLLLCDSDGGALCLGRVDISSRGCRSPKFRGRGANGIPQPSGFPLSRE